eukprot:1081056-Rhodomonas_salina.1
MFAADRRYAATRRPSLPPPFGPPSLPAFSSSCLPASFPPTLKSDPGVAQTLEESMAGRGRGT